MAIAHSGTPQGAGFAATTAPVITLPTGLTAGDLIVLAINTQAAGNSTTIAASGWTRHAASGESGGGVQTFLFWKVYAAGDPSTVTAANSVSSAGGYETGAYSGCDTSAPFGTANVTTNASNTALNVAAMTTTKANSYGIICAGTGSGSATFNVFPTGYTTVATATTQKTGNLCDQSFPSSGTATGALTYTLSVAAQGASIQVELFAAPAAGGAFAPSSMLPLTGLGLPGSPTVAPPLGPASGSPPSAFDIITPLPATQFVNPLSLVLAAQLFPAVQPYVQPSTAVAYTDSASGTITLSGTSTESQVDAGSPTGTITLSGTASQSFSHSSSGTGTITLSGTATGSHVYSDSRSGTITLSGSATQSWTTAAAATGTITLSGTGFDNYVPPSGGVSRVNTTDDPNLVQHLFAGVR